MERFTSKQRYRAVTFQGLGAAVPASSPPSCQVLGTSENLDFGAATVLASDHWHRPGSRDVCRLPTTISFKDEPTVSHVRQRYLSRVSVPAGVLVVAALVVVPGQAQAATFTTQAGATYNLTAP